MLNYSLDMDTNPAQGVGGGEEWYLESCKEEERDALKQDLKEG